MLQQANSTTDEHGWDSQRAKRKFNADGRRYFMILYDQTIDLV
jgi:hypothetical protein